MGIQQRRMPVRTSRWETTPSVLASRPTSSFNNDPKQAPPPSKTILTSNNPTPAASAPSEYRGNRRTSGFDPQPSGGTISSAEPVPETTAMPSMQENINPTQPSERFTPTMKVGIIENKGGEQERQEYQKQLQLQKEARDREFQNKLKSITDGVQTSPSKSNNSVNLDPYGGSGDNKNTRDRLSMLKMRFD